MLAEIGALGMIGIFVLVVVGMVSPVKMLFFGGLIMIIGIVFPPFMFFCEPIGGALAAGGGLGLALGFGK